MYKLQDIDLKPVIGNEQIGEMYYRATNEPIIIASEQNHIKIRKGTYLETFTYFGSLSAEKWKKYTYVDRFYLVLDVEGDFDLTLFGHYQESKIIKKEWLGKFRYKLDERTTVVVPFPENFQIR